MRGRAKVRNDRLLKLHMSEVPERAQALAPAGVKGFEPLVYGAVIIFRAREEG